ncbi:MAG: segregation/condensation protein A [Elusimicrobiota bacterium]|jgi:segregation and condensation protein A|nr:segregation/condensation protein A [Elusimicrobiota bacterium]
MFNLIEYDVHTDSFEGPLDLLLRITKKNDLEISEINISEITSEYLSYLNLMRDLNIEITGEFLVMAATLMQIKIRKLLPSNEIQDEQDEEFVSLKQKMDEYAKYKEAGKILSYKMVQNSQIFYRPHIPLSKDDFILNANIFDLINCFQKVLNDLPDEVSIKEIIYQEIPIETKKRELLDVLEGKETVSFMEFLKTQQNKSALVVCFIAVLHLMRDKQIAAMQSELFSDIRIYKISDSVDLDGESELENEVLENLQDNDLELISQQSNIPENQED